MFVPSVAVDHEIVKIRCSEVIQPTDQLIHQPLKGGGCSLQTKWHDSKLEEARLCGKCSFLLGFCSERNLVR